MHRTINLLAITCLLSVVHIPLPSFASSDAGGMYRDVIIIKDITGSISANHAGYSKHTMLRERLTEEDAFFPLSHDTVALMLDMHRSSIAMPDALKEAHRAFLASRATYPKADQDGYILEKRLLALHDSGAKEEAASFVATLPAEVLNPELIRLRDMLLADSAHEKATAAMCDGRDIRAEAVRQRGLKNIYFSADEDMARMFCALIHEDDSAKLIRRAELFIEQYAADSTDIEIKRRSALVDMARYSQQEAYEAWIALLKEAFNSAAPISSDMSDLFNGKHPEILAEQLFSDASLWKDARRAALADVWTAYFVSKQQPLPFSLVRALIQSDHTGAGMSALYYQLFAQGGLDYIDTGLKKDAAILLSDSGFNHAAKELYPYPIGVRVPPVASGVDNMNENPSDDIRAMKKRISDTSEKDISDGTPDSAAGEKSTTVDASSKTVTKKGADEQTSVIQEGTSRRYRRYRYKR